MFLEPNRRFGCGELAEGPNLLGRPGERPGRTKHSLQHTAAKPTAAPGSLVQPELLSPPSDQKPKQPIY